MIKMGLHRHVLVEISHPQHLKLLHPSFPTTERGVNSECRVKGDNEDESMSILKVFDNEL